MQSKPQDAMETDSIELSIVIPAYNESNRILGTLEEAARVLPGLEPRSEVVVVDDGSTDDTAALVESARATFPLPLKLVSLPHRGKGSAVRAGMLAARGSFRVLCDADLATPFESVQLLLEPARRNGTEVVIASRQKKGAVRQDESWVRHLLGRGFNLTVRLVTGLKGIEDTQCGYKLFTDASAKAVFERVTIEGFAFDVEALVIASALGFRIEEIPIIWRSVPESKVRAIQDTMGMFRQLLRIRRNRGSGKYE